MKGGKTTATAKKTHLQNNLSPVLRGGRNGIGRREKWPKQSWEVGEIGRKSREEGEKEKLGVGRIELDGPG